MSRKLSSVTFLALLGVVALAGNVAAANGFSALKGKRIPGTGSNWIPIASPFAHPKDVAGTITPPIETNTVAYSVSFFEFASDRAAATFYAGPPVAARLITFGIQAYRSLPGPTGVPGPSRGLDLRQCLIAKGPARGMPGGTLTPNGNCTLGVPSSFGVATIIQRGPIVVIVQSVQTTVVGGFASSSELTQNTSLALRTLTLLRSVGLD